MIKFSLSRLEKEPIELSGEEPASLLEIEPTELLSISSPIRYHLTARMVSGNVLVSGSAATELSGICGRCLKQVKRKIELPELCLYFDELDDLEELDVTPELRSEVILALPMNLLCKEDCQGLCPKCGANLNSSPCHCADSPASPPGGPGSPWDALDQLKLKD